MFRDFFDNLLVEVENFTILGVSFCVTRNAFNLIKIKNKNVGANFRKHFIPLCGTFKKLELLVLFASHIILHCNVSIVVFDGC